MLLRKVVLQNYGLYKGNNTFDLVPQKKRGSKEVKPIILFGGKNCQYEGGSSRIGFLPLIF